MEKYMTQEELDWFWPVLIFVILFALIT